MERLVKKHFWVFNLLVLAAAAYVAADVVNGFIASRALPYPSVTLPKKKAALPKRRDNDALDYANNLSVWPIFAKVAEDQPKTPTGPIDPKKKDDEEPQLSDLNVKLIGTMVVDERPELSSAIVDINAEYTSVAIGSKLGTTKATVVAIYAKFIQVDEGNNRLKYIVMNDDGTDGKKKLPLNRTLKRSPYRRPGRRPFTPRVNRFKRINYSSKVRKTGAFTYTIDRNMVKQNLEDLSDVTRQARVVPTYRSGRFNGLKLSWVSYNSIYRAIGLQSGDTLR
ncbi:MAG: hypothetical protein KC609_15210, partial [Myxococcales bacterium]|nr:hypothetical protein [Myxococcales bacterium]